MPKRDMLINNVPGEECRIAIIEDGKLEELYHERTSIESHVGSIFKAKVTNVEPSIQAAFVDFGLERNGFLHVTDLHPRYFPGQHKEETERVGHKTPHRERPPIQKCLKRGQEILVQVIKEGLGTKGPTVTSYLSIPGRFLVMMPAMERLGVSRKVDDDDARREMRKLLDELNPPDDFGFIIRTAGMGRPKTDLKRDLSYLVRLWKNLEKKMAKPGVGELYTESDLMIRTIRDVYSTDIDRIIVDEPTAAKRASDFLAIASPRAKSNVLYYEDPIPLFHRYGVEAQIETIHARRVPLPSGGSLVIDSTEALVAIDVNSGKMRNSGDAETTAFRVNAEACDEVCRQLRLRDLGGVVVIDLIDMRSPSKRRTIEQRFRDNLKRDRARTKPLAISQFGILEMTRQRMRPALTKSVYNDCHYCHGEGTVKNVDSIVMEVMRQLSLVVHRREVSRLAVTVSPDVAFPLLNRKRSELVGMEQKYNTPIQVRVNPSGAIDFIELLPMDERGNALNVDGLKNMAPPVLHPVESMPVDDDLNDDDTQTQEMETRATKVERIDEGADPGDDEDREDRGEPVKVGREDRSRGESVQDSASGEGDGEGDGEGGRKRRRRRRGRRGRGGQSAQEEGGGEGEQAAEGAAPQSQPSRNQGAPQGRQGGHGGGTNPQNRPPQQNNQQRGQQGQKPQPQRNQGQQGGPQKSQPSRDGQPARDGQRAQQPQRDQQGPAPVVSRGYSRDGDRPKPPIVITDDNFGNIKDEVLADVVGPGDGNSNGGNSGGRNNQGGGQQRLGPDGQPLKKRRRRGGRRHRRRREAQQRAEQERLAAGLPPMTDAEREDVGNRADDLAAAQGHEDGDDYEGGQGRDEQDSQDTHDTHDTQDASHIVEVADKPNVKVAVKTSAVAEADASDEDDSTDEESTDEPQTPKKKTKKKTTRRPAAKTQPAAAKTGDDAKPAPKKKKKVAKRPARKAPTRKPPQSKAMADDVTSQPTE